MRKLIVKLVKVKKGHTFGLSFWFEITSLSGSSGETARENGEINIKCKQRFDGRIPRKITQPLRELVSDQINPSLSLASILKALFHKFGCQNNNILIKTKYFVWFHIFIRF